MNPDIGSLGFYAFHGYAGAMNGLTHDGRQIPKWDDLGDDVRHAWDMAATVAINEATNRASHAWTLTHQALNLKPGAS